MQPAALSADASADACRDLERERRSILQTVSVLSHVMEARDPYTHGHQARAATLARVVGSEMGLDRDIIEGLRIGATLHDLGKVSVPIEILSKPGPLHATEIALVRRHPQVGFDLLQHVDFPWPVAQMILQHHERIDGSGYPNGLVGDQILLEARILAVADTVESMMAHRPYRSRFPEDVTLMAIAKESGRTLDADVVRTCLKVFAEDRALLPEFM